MLRVNNHGCNKDARGSGELDDIDGNVDDGNCSGGNEVVAEILAELNRALDYLIAKSSVSRAYHKFISLDAHYFLVQFSSSS